MKKKTMAGLIAIVAVAAVLIFAGSAVYKEEKPPASASTQDSEFWGWVSETIEQLQLHTTLLTEAEGRYDFAAIERYAGMLYDDANKALSEIDRFSVSPELQPAKDEFKLALQDLKQEAYYTERGARNIDPARSNIFRSFLVIHCIIHFLQNCHHFP